MNFNIWHKRFIFKLSIFMGLGILVYVSLGWALLGWSNERIKVKLDEKTTVIVIGHSHPECAIDPSFFPGLANFAKSGEALYYGCLKAKKVILEHPEVRTVFIEIAANQLDEHMAEWIKDEEHFQRAMKSYFFILPPTVKGTFFLEFPLQYCQAQLIAEKKLLSVCFAGESKRNVSEMEWGGFVGHDQVVQDSLQPRFECGVKKLHPYQPNLNAVLEFVQFCNDRGVEPILLRTPVHRTELDTHEASFQDCIKENFDQLKFMDYRRLSLPDSCYLDREHLNASGACIFTKVLFSDYCK
jgi:hypothetical protein